MPKYSAVIPLYNKAAYVSRAIDSVLGQDFRDLELIVVNDGSTDGGQRIVESYADGRLRLINQKNSGVAAARNAGIRNSNTSYVALLDADDAWDPDFLSTIDKMTFRFPDAGAYATHIRDVRSSQPLYTESRESHCASNSCMIDNFFALLNSGRYPVSSSSVCVKRSVLIDIGMFDETLAIGEDIDAWIRVFLHSGIALSDRFAATYHTDAQNRSVHRLDFSFRELQFFRHLRNRYLNDSLGPPSFSALEQWSSRRIYNIIVRLISLDERAAARTVFRDNWRALAPDQRVMALLRLGAPNPLMQFLRQCRRPSA